MKRYALAGLVAAILTACGSLTGMHPASVPAPVINPATPTASAPPSSTPSAAAPPPAAVATAAPPVPMMLGRTVPLIAISGSHVNGLVQLTEWNGSFVATVSARGLAPGLHTVHIHRGSCANPYAGIHLTVLGLLAANGSGAGALTAGIGSVYVTSGRYVIVYASTSPQVIVACADLVALI